MVAFLACHCLSYLALCARSRINVLAYEDKAIGTMASPDLRDGPKFGQVAP